MSTYHCIISIEPIVVSIVMTWRFVIFEVFVFLFLFLDGLYFYVYDKDDSRNKIERGGRNDRGINEFKPYFHIPIESLRPIEEINNILNNMGELIHFCFLKLINFLLFVLPSLFSVFSHHIFFTNLFLSFFFLHK